MAEYSFVGPGCAGSFRASLQSLAAEIAEDRESLRAAMHALEVKPDLLRPAIGRLGEKVGRFKPNGLLIGAPVDWPSKSGARATRVVRLRPSSGRAVGLDDRAQLGRGRAVKDHGIGTEVHLPTDRRRTLLG